MKKGPPLLAAAVLSALLCTAAAAGAEVDVGDSPELEVVTLQGEEVSLDDYRGQVLLVDLWATWCAPCRRSMPFYSRLYEEHQSSGFEILAISVDEDRRAVEAFRRRHELSFPIVVDADGEAAALFGPPAMPTAYLIDRRGQVRYRHVGFSDRDKQAFEEKLQTLLSEEVGEEAQDERDEREEQKEEEQR